MRVASSATAKYARAGILREKDIEIDLFFVIKALREYKQAEIDGQLEAVRPDLAAAAQKRLEALKGRRYRLAVAYIDKAFEDR